jgi:5-methylcytosine-specific restriction protein A
MSDRPFRRAESYEAEDVTRNMLPSFLQDRGFVVESDNRQRKGQTLVVESPEGERLTMRVHLCWRRETGSRDSERARTYSAAQLMARIKNDDWIGSLQAKVDRQRSRGVTHLLFVQRDDKDIKYAALVPLSVLVPIWTDQRDISQRLIDQGRLGRRKKNHAMNGTSPTLWLQDDRGGKEVADALWNHSGVRNLAELPRTAPQSFLPEEVTEPSRYMEGACRRISVNAFERDEKARRRCTEHHGTKCCVCGFDFGAVYGVQFAGFIHVHHLRPLSEARGEYMVDPVEDLRPVCPNCHAVIHRRDGLRGISEVQGLMAAAKERRTKHGT